MDRLEHMLKAADSATESLAPSGDLAFRVRRSARRRRTYRVGAAGASLLAIALLAIRWNGTSGPVVAEVPMTVESLRAELFEIQSQTDSRMAGVERYLQRQDHRSSRPTLAADDSIRREQDRAALLMILRADRMYHELRRKDSAMADYRRVLELFPSTPAADLARQRLAMIQG